MAVKHIIAQGIGFGTPTDHANFYLPTHGFRNRIEVAPPQESFAPLPLQWPIAIGYSLFLWICF